MKLLQRNAAVFLLPLILMGVIFFGGYLFLKQSSQFTNEQLAETIFLNVRVKQTENRTTIEGEWDWNEVPQDEIVGDDFIGITLLDENHHPVDFQAAKATLKLYDDNNVIFQTTGEKRGKGYLFTFPNKLEGQHLYGYRGLFSLETNGAILEDGMKIAVSYLHTWKDGVRFPSDDTRFQQVDFAKDIDGHYWVIERFYP